MIYSENMLSLYLFLATSIGFFIYSFTHVDLNLTLSSHPLVLKIISSLQQIAYYDRPLSTNIYLALSIFAIILYLYIVFKLSQKLKKFPWKVVGAIGLIFALAYPFLSHDMFNYVFYARTIIKYKQNPYIAAPNWFLGDEWLRFMHWTHKPSPYGPFHAFIVLPSYILGLGKLTLSLFWIKIINFSFYIVSIRTIGTITKILKRSKREIIQAQLLLALNPLILVDSLANGHNDAVMMAIYLLSLMFLLQRKFLKSAVALLLSVGVKYITIVLVPVYFLFNKLSKEKLINIQVIAFTILVPLFYTYYGFQVWYATWALYTMPLSKSTSLKGAVLLFTIGGLLYYSSYIFTGLWNQEPAFTKTIMFAIPFAFAVLHSSISFLLRRSS